VPAVRVRQRLDVVDRPALLAAGQLGGADHGAQPPVAFGVPGQDEQMAPFRVGRLTRVGRQADAQFRAEHCAQLRAAPVGEPPRGLRELRRPVHPVVVGEGEYLEPEPGGLGDQLAGGGRPVQEAVRGVAVQFGPRRADRLQAARRQAGRTGQA